MSLKCGIVGLPKVQIPGAQALLGSWAPLISGFTPIVYVAFMAVPLLVLFYNRTRLGIVFQQFAARLGASRACAMPNSSQYLSQAGILCANSLTVEASNGACGM